jgi:tRNA-binding protein
VEKYLKNKNINLCRSNELDHISWDEFEKVELCVGTIIKVEDFPKAKKPAYILHIDFGSDIGIKKSSAQITHIYSKEDLTYKQIIAVVNFPPKQIGPIISECLVTGFYNNKNEVILAVPDKQISNGTKLA